jgi:hypothetical protein
VVVSNVVVVSEFALTCDAVTGGFAGKIRKEKIAKVVMRARRSGANARSCASRITGLQGVNRRVPY